MIVALLTQSWHSEGDVSSCRSQSMWLGSAADCIQPSCVKNHMSRVFNHPLPIAIQLRTCRTRLVSSSAENW